MENQKNRENLRIMYVLIVDLATRIIMMSIENQGDVEGDLPPVVVPASELGNFDFRHDRLW